MFFFSSRRRHTICGRDWSSDVCSSDLLRRTRELDFRFLVGVDISGDKQAMQRLRDAGEKAKIELTSASETTINLPFIAQRSEERRVGKECRSRWSPYH